MDHLHREVDVALHLSLPVSPMAYVIISKYPYFEENRLTLRLPAVVSGSTLERVADSMGRSFEFLFSCSTAPSLVEWTSGGKTASCKAVACSFLPTCAADTGTSDS